MEIEQPSSMAQLIDDEAMVPIIYPWQNHTSAMAGMASWARGKDWPPHPVMLWHTSTTDSAQKARSSAGPLHMHTHVGCM